MLGMATLVSMVLKVVRSALRDSTSIVSGTQPAPIAQMGSPPVAQDSQGVQSVSVDFNTVYFCVVYFIFYKKTTKKQQVSDNFLHTFALIC